ncbi:hypothetical protein MMC28_007542 [Mycoblastus sanguinarius]|nr:hypothetical protein [Mycoblastus sanguinarius]
MIEAFINPKPLSQVISSAIKDSVSTGLDRCLSEGGLQEFSSNGAKRAAERAIAKEVIRLISGHMDGKNSQDQFISLQRAQR